MIIGYLDQPIQNEAGKAVGVICAITDTPRTWSEIDVLAMQISVQKVEFLLQSEFQKHQLKRCYEALDGYDGILSAIALNTNELASVHDPDGEMLFATERLLTEVNPCFEEVKSCWNDNFKPRLELSWDRCNGQSETELQKTETSFANPGAKTAKCVIKGQAPRAGSWRGQLKGRAGNLSFIGWEPEQPVVTDPRDLYRRPVP